MSIAAINAHAQLVALWRSWELSSARLPPQPEEGLEATSTTAAPASATASGPSQNELAIELWHEVPPPHTWLPPQPEELADPTLDPPQLMGPSLPDGGHGAMPQDFFAGSGAMPQDPILQLRSVSRFRVSYMVFPAAD